MPPDAVTPVSPPDLCAPVFSGEPLLRAKVVAELEQLRLDMEELGVQLCLDEKVMLHCMTQLQRLDEMSQRCFWLAAVIRADDPQAVLPEITLQSLADRLETG